MSNRDNKGRFLPGESGNPSGRGSRADALERKADGWRSILTGHGYSSHDKSRSHTYIAEIVDSDNAIEVWRGDDLAARIIETWPNEMLRAGFELRIQEDEEDRPDPFASKMENFEANGKAEKAQRQIEGEIKKAGAPPFPGARGDAFGAESEDVEGDEVKSSEGEEVTSSAKDLQKSITARLEELGLTDALWEALAYERGYGGGAIFLGANDGSTDLAKPLNMDRIREFEWLTVLEPRELTPFSYYADPMKPKFGKPEIYQLNPDGMSSSNPVRSEYSAPRNIHESRLIVFPGIRVTRRNLSSTHGWGDSILTRVLPVLRDFNVGFNSAAILLNDFAQAVFKMRGLAELVAMDNRQADKTVAARMAAVELSRSTARAILIDAEGEEFERKQTPLSGLPELLDRFANRLAAAADMPLTLLMGQSPAGLNATGESDIRFFYDRIAAAQKRKLKGPIERVCQMLMRVEGEEPDSWSVNFHPLWQPTENEQATARKTQAETDAIYIANEVLHPEEVALSRFGGEEFSFETQVDFDARAELDKMEAEQKAAEAEEQAKQLAENPPAPPPAPGQQPPAGGGDLKSQLKKALK